MYEAMGDIQRARVVSKETAERATRAIELNPNDSRALILGAGAWQTLGEEKKALEWAGRAYEVDPGSSGMMYNSACIYAKLGETERALDFLEKAVELGGRNKRYYENDSDFDSIRDHPRFKALLERV
jgi:adenylate cyclase